MLPLSLCPPLLLLLRQQPALLLLSPLLRQKQRLAVRESREHQVLLHAHSLTHTRTRGAGDGREGEREREEGERESSTASPALCAVWVSVCVVTMYISRQSAHRILRRHRFRDIAEYRPAMQVQDRKNTNTLTDCAASSPHRLKSHRKS